jgi:hypothetical protein
MNASLREAHTRAEPAVSGKRRCAIVECYSRHDEVYLTTVHLLEQLGYEVHLFTVWRNNLRNSFVHAPGLRPQVHVLLNAAQVLAAVRQHRFDFVVMNTFEGPEVLTTVAELLQHTPVLGFLHNASLIRNLPDYRPLLEHPRLRLMTLAPYVTEDVEKTAPAGTLVPVFFFDRAVPRLAYNEGKRRFCVQGYFDPKRRHYGQFLEALTALRAEGRTNFEVVVMGRNFGRTFRDFAKQVREAGLADHVSYTWKGIGYRRYYRLLNSVDFVLPLISPESHGTYFRSKSTSSIAAAVGFNALPIAHEKLAQSYSLGDIAITYTQDLADALRRALDLSDVDLAQRRQQLAAAKQRFLDDSRASLQQAIASVGARAG